MPLTELCGLLAGRRRLFRVQGTSMLPALDPGDMVAVAVRPRRLPEPGEVVVVRHPKDTTRVLVKRTRSRGDETFAVGSDSPGDATDSREFGSLRQEHLLGRAMWAWSSQRGFRRLL